MGSFNDEYLKLRKKRLEEQEEIKSSVPYQRQLNTSAPVNSPTYAERVLSGDIAPVKTTPQKEEKGEKWYDGFLQLGEALSDGYQFGDITKTLIESDADVATNLISGVVGWGEDTIDAAATAIGGITEKLGMDGATEKLRDFVEKDLYDPNEVARKILSSNVLGIMNPQMMAFSTAIKGIFTLDDWLNSKEVDNGFGGTTTVREDNSVFGDNADSMFQSAGEMLTKKGIQAAAGGIPIGDIITGVTVYGAQAEQALKEDATFAQAGGSGLISAGAEIIFEKLSGGIKIGGVAVDDGLRKIISKNISSVALKTAINMGLDVTGEAAEEVLTEFVQKLGTKLYKEEDLGEILFSEEALTDYARAAFSGGLMGGAFNVSDVVSGVANNVDYKSGLSENEQKVVNKEYENRLAEQEQDGKKLTVKEKSDLYDKVMKDLEKGYISTDTIEEVLGGEDYTNYKNELKRQQDIDNELNELRNMKSGEMTDIQIERMAELKAMTPNTEMTNALKFSIDEKIRNALSSERNGKGSYLYESYNEQTRRGQAFEADLSKYDSKQAEIVKRAIDSGILNNTNRTHDFVDMVAKISADKGVLFDFANNAKLKESGFAVDGKFVNGYVTKDGITVNIDSNKALNSIVGHEITHVLEGTELYAALKVSIQEYAKSKGDYQSRLDTLTKLYEGVEGADVSAELTADLVGDYLFTDEDFIKHLSTTNRNVFQRIYDEIKYLYKVATAGSKQARELEKVKHTFEKVWRESGQKNTAADGGTKYSLEQVDGVDYVKTDKSIFTKEDGTLASEREVFNSLVGKTISLPDGDVKIVKRLPGKDMYNELSRRYPKQLGGIENVKQLNSDVNYNMEELLTNSKAQELNVQDIDNRHAKQGITDFDTRTVKFYDGDKAYDIEFSIATLQNGEKVAYAKKYFGYDAELTKKIQIAEVRSNQSPLNQQSAFNSIIPQNSEKSTGNTKFYLSDSDGKKLTKEQSEYFKDSKMRDDNGNLKVMYHGSQDAGFHIFDANMSDDDTSFFFVDRNDVAASYSGTSETYAPKAFKTVEDANKFFAEIDATEYEVVENNGKYTLLEDGDEIATNDDLAEIYEEWRDWSGLGYGDANYKVYLNLTNPLEIDAKGRPWNKIDAEFSQDVYDRYKSLTAEEKAALVDLAEWEDFRIFNSEIQEAVGNELASAYAKMGENVNIYDLFSVAADNFSEESMRENARHYLKTRDFAQRAKEGGYDGVIFKNIIDNGGYSNGDEGASTVAIAFESNQIKSVANDKPTADKDIRYSLSEDSEGRKLSEGQAERFKDSLVRDNNGNLKVVYHGSGAEFTVFSHKFVGTHGSMEGQGFYFTDKKSMAEGYQKNGAKLMEGYLDIKKPLSDSELTLSRAEVTKLVKAIDPTGDNVVINYDPSGVGYPSKAWYNRALSATVDSLMQYCDTDSELLADIANSGAQTEAVVSKARELFGYDGYIVSDKYENATIYVAFESNQFKNVDNLNPTDDPDIRYSLSDTNEASTKQYGKYNVYGKDIRLSGANDIAPVGVAENAITTEDNSVDMGDEFAPVVNSYTIEQELDEIGREIESLAEESTELYNNGDEEAAMKLVERINELSTQDRRLREQAESLKAQEEAEYKAYMVSLAEVEPPVETERAYSEADTTPLDDKTLKVLTKSVRNVLSAMPKENKAIREVIEKYSTTDQKKSELFRELKEKFGDKYEYHRYSDIAEAKKVLRTYKFNVSEQVKGDIADFRDYKKSHNVRTSKNALSVDVLYEELSELYPGLFPADITNETDRFERISEVSVMPAAEWVKVAELSDDEIMQAVDFIHNEVTQHKNNATRKAAEADARAYIDDVAPSRAKEITEKPLNDTAPRYQDINSRLEQEKATLTKEFEQKKAQMQSELANKNAFISNKAKELYNEIRNLKKGVRASKELGYILDHGYEWKSIKTALINAMNSPGKIVNTNSAAEGVVREVLKDIYESSMYDLSDMDNEYQKQLAKLEAKAEKERSGVQIKTVKERVAEKLSNVETELVNNKRLRAESIVDFNREIARLQEEYNSKANKNTQAANDILRRIERLQRMKNNVDTDYEKRISDLEAKKTKLSEEARTGTSATEQAVMRAELHLSKIDNIRAKFAEKGLDFDKTLKKAKDLSTFTTVDNTPQRVMEKALGYKEGQILADLTVNKIAQDESKGVKWLNSYTDRKNGLLAQISKQYNIKPGSKKSAAAQMYAEGFYVNKDNEIIKYGDNELAADFPNAKVRENIKALARDTRIRKIYDDTLDMINDSRARNAYPEIQKLDNYFLHFRAMDDTFSQLGLPFNPNDIRAKDLPTDLNGVTADLKPGQPYFASSMHREGIKTSYDLLGGLERYLSSAEKQIYHIDNIQTLRALRNHIADTYGQANGLEGLDALSEAEAQEKIKQVFNAHLSTFAKFLNEEANIIAGKTALIDRGFEGIFGRRAMTFMDTLNKQVGANMVGYNVSSSLTNFLAPVQAFAKTNKVAFVKGFAQTVYNRLGSITGKTDGFAENSSVMIRRKGADRFYRTPFQKVSDAGYVLMSAVDDISTEIIARAKYNELTAKGMSAEQAHFETDKWVSRLMGDRSLGQMPQLYNSKTLGLITKFQLEVRNQLDSQFYDSIQEAKADNATIENALARNAKTAAKVASTFTQLAIAQHLFGKAFESIAGYNPAFDIIEVIMTALGFDDDEESEDTAIDNIQQGFLALLEDLPYTSTLTGGRIPISSALPITELIKGEDKYGNEVGFFETLGEIAPYYVLPGGYGQIKKTIQGLGMFSDEHPIAGSYTDSGKLRFPVDETFGNVAQAAIFGQYASQNARDYFDNDIAPLNEKQTQEFIDVDMDIHDYWDYREGLSQYKTLAEKADYINSLNLTDEQKNVLINNIADRKEDIDMSDYDDYSSFEEFDYANKYPEKYEFWKHNGISYEDYASGDDDTKAAYNWAYENPNKFTLSKAVASDVVTYRQYTKELYDIKADKDSDGKSISGSRKAKVINYINDLDADYGSKIILFKSEYPADDTYNVEIVKYLNSREDISYKEMETILKELGFTVDSKGNISWD